MDEGTSLNSFVIFSNVQVLFFEDMAISQQMRAVAALDVMYPCPSLQSNHFFADTKGNFGHIFSIQGGCEWYWHVQCDVDEEWHGACLSCTQHNKPAGSFTVLLISDCAANQALGIH